MPFPLPSDPFNRSTPLLLAADRDGTYQPYVYVTVFEEPRLSFRTPSVHSSILCHYTTSPPLHLLSSISSPPPPLTPIPSAHPTKMLSLWHCLMISVS
jgi:hypothetical protein